MIQCFLETLNTLWRYAEAYNLSPGVFRITPFIDQPAWQPFLLNGADGLRIELREVPLALPRDETLWFLRPVDDSKALTSAARRAGSICWKPIASMQRGFMRRIWIGLSPPLKPSNDRG